MMQSVMSRSTLNPAVRVDAIDDAGDLLSSNNTETAMDADVLDADRRMTDGEQTLALVSGALVMMWALRRGRWIPMAAMGLAGPLLAAGLRKRWPSELIAWSRSRHRSLGRYS